MEWISVNNKQPEDIYDFKIKDGLSRIMRFLCYLAPAKGDFTRGVIKMCSREVTRSGKARWMGVDGWHTVTHWANIEPPKED